MKTLIKWSVEDGYQMIEAGILRDRPVELLAGEIVEIPRLNSHSLQHCKARF